jgi:hypothetical protein
MTSANKGELNRNFMRANTKEAIALTSRMIPTDRITTMRLFKNEKRKLPFIRDAKLARVGCFGKAHTEIAKNSNCPLNPD